MDGICGPKTWSVLLTKDFSLTTNTEKFLSEDNLKEFAQKYSLELATIKAVNEVESRGKGFLNDGRPVILFEGHIFWRLIKQANLDPDSFVNEFTQNILYGKWTKKHYQGGVKEYSRLEKAAGMSDDEKIKDAAYSSASWGSYQIMGFHATNLGYTSIDQFVSKMYEHEKEHLKAFGMYLEYAQLIPAIQAKDWAVFAKGYNGPSYKKNKYDEKLLRAYNKYNSN